MEAKTFLNHFDQDDQDDQPCARPRVDNFAMSHTPITNSFALSSFTCRWRLKAGRSEGGENMIQEVASKDSAVVSSRPIYNP